MSGAGLGSLFDYSTESATNSPSVGDAYWEVIEVILKLEQDAHLEEDLRYEVLRLKRTLSFHENFLLNDRLRFLFHSSTDINSSALRIIET
ncbi:hypothetical protein R1flu_026508 [Riccia fluitans]|uniref:Uncharacterized protein n=1 Tax=Riccia fluitans TaxID=41844 RepID=A0ABD1XG73_9MARC